MGKHKRRRDHSRSPERRHSSRSVQDKLDELISLLQPQPSKRRRHLSNTDSTVQGGDNRQPTVHQQPKAGCSTESTEGSPACSSVRRQPALHDPGVASSRVAADFPLELNSGQNSPVELDDNFMYNVDQEDPIDLDAVVEDNIQGDSPAPPLALFQQNTAGKNQAEMTLDTDTLRLLGDEGGTVAVTSPPIHVDLVTIWSGILKTGLKDELRDSLIARYPVAENCPKMAPPKMNLEVKAVVNEAAVKRDSRFSTIQAMLGASLSALGQSLTTILGNAAQEESRANLLASIGDAARLIAGVHQQQSQARRLILRAQLNKSLSETLSEAPGDDGWLFGENLSERIQSAKALDRTAAQLRKAKEPAKPRVGSTSTNIKTFSGNLRGPSRLQYRAPRPGGQKEAVSRKYPPQRPQPAISRRTEYRRQK